MMCTKSQSNHFCSNIFAIACIFIFSQISSALTAEQPSTKPSSTLITNFDKKFDVQKDVRQMPVSIGIYDVGYVVYSKEFAERFGYPEKNIAELDSGMQALEFRMRTEGGFVHCYLNTLLDNTLDLDLPEQDYQSRFERHGDMMRFPKKLDSYKDEKGWYKELQEDKEFRMNMTQDKWHYYSRNTRLASYDYAPGKKEVWASSYFFESYTNKYIKGLDYVSISISCGAQPYQELQRKDVSLWLKKKGGDDYSMRSGTKPDQFLKFRLPESFTKPVVELMRPVTKEKYNFFKQVEKQ